LLANAATLTTMSARGFNFHLSLIFLLAFWGQEVLLFPAMKPQDEPSAKGTSHPDS